MYFILYILVVNFDSAVKEKKTETEMRLRMKLEQKIQYKRSC